MIKNNISERCMYFEEGLSRVGLKPEEIDIVIISHLHYDHFVNAAKYKNARAIIQKRELDFALNPHPLFARSFKKEWHEGINFHVIDGGQEIAPGIQVLLTPGHAAGNQFVLIQTSKGKAVIAGFCSTFQTFNPGVKGRLAVNLVKGGKACKDERFFYLSPFTGKRKRRNRKWEQ